MALICHCRVVSDREIVAAIEAGARTVEAIGEACGASTECGGCRPSVEELLDSVLTRVPATS